jgi:single-stranded-DNA-specific exonuclease
MTNQEKRWEILIKKSPKSEEEIIDGLLKNRGIKTSKQKEEFFNPADPMKISLKSIGIKEIEVKKAIDRIKKAKKSGEHVIIYGDYDADGITGTAALWETLHELGIFVLPHIPERFSEGYGLNADSIKKLKTLNPKLKLIITVDHGIVANKKIDLARELGIDVIITDHHHPSTTLTSSRGLRPRVGGASVRGKERRSVFPNALAIIHTEKISGSAVAWFFSREIVRQLRIKNEELRIRERLQLAAIGTIADQLPLLGANRSVVKYGLSYLNKTTRPGLIELIKNAGIEKGNIGTYEVGFIIAPRINSMGRLENAIDSLRLLCTPNRERAVQIARHIANTNLERQKIVEEVVVHARQNVDDHKIIVLAHRNYHEGVIGLAAARLVEEFYRPAIVLSKKGKVSKASARSISGFNIIEAIRSLADLYIEGGGHPMAAGFSIETKKITEFSKRINKIAKGLLTEEILSRKLKIDLEVKFVNLNYKLFDQIRVFEPTGLGNPTPTFITGGVEVLDARTVGREARHLKLKLKQDEQVFDSIFFDGGEIYSKLTPDTKIDIVYQLEEDVWNGLKSLQLKIKDLKLPG